jgi:hypothetical protein
MVRYITQANEHVGIDCGLDAAIMVNEGRNRDSIVIFAWNGQDYSPVADLTKDECYEFARILLNHASRLGD